MYLRPLQIGNVKLENNIILAPMAGITDKAFRIITKEFNPGLVVTEMASAKAIFYDDTKTKKLLNIENEQRPISVQIFGSDILSIKVAAEYVSGFADILDINMGCPAPKVVKNGDGSRLLLNLELAKEILEAAVQVSKVPVTLKFRKGWSEDSIVACEIAKIAEAAGVKMLTIHGRTRDQFYTGEVDLEIIKKVKESVKIPVIGNGDIRSKEDAKKMLEYTKVDGIMIGRATIGNPWLIQDIVNYLKDEENYKYHKITKEEKLHTIKKHLDLVIQDKGEKIAIKEMRKYIAYYVKNLKDSTKIREKVNSIDNKKELIETLEEYFKTMPLEE